MFETTQFHIAGAGVAGLATANALAQRRAPVSVYDPAPAITEVGAGLQISPNGFAVMDALGLGDALRDRSLESRAVVLRNQAGREVLRMDLAQHAHGVFLLAHRAALIDVLYEGIKGLGVDLHLNKAVDTPLSVPDDQLWIAADGVRSKTRAKMNRDGNPFFTGQVAWRALIEGDGPPEAEVFMGPGCHLVSYPLRGGLRNIVAVQERSAWAEDSWNARDDPDNLRAAFKGFGGPVQDWLAQVKTVQIWGLFRREVARVWHKNRTALVGDAAHPTLPFLAQGANLALEDAWVLTQCLADHETAAAAFESYQFKRHDRAIRVIKAANNNARNYHIRNKGLQAIAHSGLRVGSRLFPQAALKKYAWIYGHDVTRS
ncbi:FAD-dependent monooxygenase [Nereida sp. MMG025]|uniref:FAD-dependent monooxygenase n=1 Tax=Nereida sp. MMG025 TaxID=2909981 RepID=UPI001F014AAE|nr:FAD-dependent monooxygenase [Nereida sp. MMG025]MCF6443552.1 FAD-dependent monooxygenase [Nereida sp. MMG025]